jgi:hypothetical protein
MILNEVETANKKAAKMLKNGREGTLLPFKDTIEAVGSFGGGIG